MTRHTARETARQRTHVHGGLARSRGLHAAAAAVGVAVMAAEAVRVEAVRMAAVREECWVTPAVLPVSVRGDGALVVVRRRRWWQHGRWRHRR